jgi:putative transposase
MAKDEIVQGVYSKKFEVVLAVAVTSKGNAQDGANSIIDLSSLTLRERKMLDRRYEYVKALQRAKVTRGQRHRVGTVIAAVSLKLGEAKPPSTSTVMKWARDYQTKGDNVIALVDRYRLVPRSKQIPQVLEDTVWRVLRRSYFTRERHSAQHAFNQLQIEISKMAKAGEIAGADAAISYPTLMRRIKDVDLYQRIATREGSARARMVCRTSFPDGYPEYILDRVEIDHTPLNWVVVCDRTGLPLGRPVLTIMIDAYSGYVLGFYLSFHGPGLTSVSGVVRSALQPKSEIVRSANLVNPWLSHGLGDEWVLDNGLEFHSFGFKQIAMALGVDLMYCRVRTPWLKPRVERFFSTLNTLTLAKGKVSKKVANVMNIDPYKDAAITFSDLVNGLLQFFVDVHPFEPNWRKMARPFDLFNEGLERCPPAIYPGSLEDLKLASGMSKILTFGQGGIENLGLPYGSYEFKELANRHGTGIKVLCKWDPDDMSQLYVQDPKTLQWMTAECRWKQYSNGLSHNQHSLIRKFAKQELITSGALESLLAAKQRLHDHWMDATTTRKRADALTAGRYADFTSSRVVEPQPVSVAATPVTDAATKLQLPLDTPPKIKDIPNFDSFSF